MYCWKGNDLSICESVVFFVVYSLFVFYIALIVIGNVVFF